MTPLFAARGSSGRRRPSPGTESQVQFRITLAGGVGRAKVQAGSSHWSGIRDLSRPEDCQGGTEVFRHIPTNTERAPYDDAELAAIGYASRKEMFSEVINRDGTDDSKWEKTMRVPLRFNRLVLLRPWLWHTAGPAFGDRMENGGRRAEKRRGGREWGHACKLRCVP